MQPDLRTAAKDSYSSIVGHPYLPHTLGISVTHADLIWKFSLLAALLSKQYTGGMASPEAFDSYIPVVCLEPIVPRSVPFPSVGSPHQSDLEPPISFSVVN